MLNEGLARGSRASEAGALSSSLLTLFRIADVGVGRPSDESEQDTEAVSRL